MAKPKILLVDDTKLMLALEQSFLKSSDVDVVTAENGVAALAEVRKSVPDLIFMDVNMPQMDGITCCRTLKEDPFFSAIPVVMVTTAGSESDRALAREAGCDNYLTKPLDRQLFLNMARSYIGTVERRVPRISCRIPVLVMQGDFLVAAQMLDISEKGVYVAAEKVPRSDLPLKIGFFLPAVGALVESAGRVAWVNDGQVKASLPPGFGVEFAELQESTRCALQRFMQRTSLKRSALL